MNFWKDLWSGFWTFVRRVLHTLDLRLLLALAVFFTVLTIILVKRLI